MSSRFFVLLFCTLFVAGCSEAEQKAVEIPPRAIKYMKISSLAASNTRKLAGVVKAGTSSNVAFEIAGSVIVMAKKVGEDVKKGELLAELDLKPIQLQVDEAEFALRQATSALEDARSKLSQQQTLWEKRFTTRTSLDTAKANFGNADGQVGIAKSQLNQKRRDLSKATLTAPFNGQVSKQNVQVFEEVNPGEAIYTLQTKGENEVEVSVPESLIPFVKVGDEVEVSFPPLNGSQVKARVTEVSPQAGDANAFPVIVRLERSPAGLRPGMSAEITLSFAGESTGKAYSVPVGALKPDVNAQQGTVFVYDPESKTVRQTAVKVVGVTGNNPEVIGFLKPGDIIATAGVGQLYDGMKVRLLDSKTAF